MYPSTFNKKFPCGLGFEWTKKDGKFKKTLMTTKQISISSLEWLDFMSNDPKFVSQNGVKCIIQHGWNSDEKKFGNYAVDGYVTVDNKVYVLEFDGCYDRYHQCPICGKEPDPERTMKEEARTHFIQNKPNVTIIRMKECQWNVMRKKVVFQPQISPILMKRQLSNEKMIQLISSNTIYGFAVCDLIPTDQAKFFLEINWPPILQKTNIEHTDLPEWMQKNAHTTTFPRRTIVQSMHGENLLLHTELIAFYIKHGFLLTNVHKVYEYEGSECYKDVYETLYKARVEATRSNNKKKAMAVKLVSNAMYGQMLLVIYFFIFCLIVQYLIFRIHESFRAQYCVMKKQPIVSENILHTKQVCN